MIEKINIICSVILTLIIISFLLIPTSIQIFEHQIKNDGFDTSSILAEKGIEIEVGTIIISAISSIFLIIKSAFFIKSTQKGNYLRDIEQVIEPVLAETIIDGKIDTKNLIMTVLIEQIYKKKIVIDGNKLILKNRWEMKEYEKEILNLIFYNSRDSVDINHLDSKCTNGSEKEIVEAYKKIKQLIKEELLKRELYKEKSIIKKVIQPVIRIFVLITLIYISLPRLPWAEAYEDMLSNIEFVAIATIMIQLMVIGICFFCNIVKKEKKLISGIGIILIPVAICIICSIIFNILNGGLGYVVNLSIIILNIIGCIYLLKRLKREQLILTNKGKEEYKKAKKLKNYIIDYSLVDDKDIDSIAIWGEYLIYATAFGIPSKVTQRFCTKLEGININLEKIEKTLNFIY